ncbi:MAG: sigma-70 family RNA polymerase sigma factor [Phycisphaerae bacterium]|nr:sigma-70 family RNA polymerase sigma factor [Phycisphaerae bacterium]
MLLAMEAYWELFRTADDALSRLARSLWSGLCRAVRHLGRRFRPRSHGSRAEVCKTTYTDLAMYAAGLLDEEGEEWLRKHLKGCEVCRPRFDSPQTAEGILAQTVPVPLLRHEVDEPLDGRILAALPPREREVLGMHAFRGMSFGEIGEVLGVSEDTAASLVHRAQTNLARVLEPVVARPSSELVSGEPRWTSV